MCCLHHQPSIDNTLACVTIRLDIPLKRPLLGCLGHHLLLHRQTLSSPDSINEPPCQVSWTTSFSAKLLQLLLRGGNEEWINLNKRRKRNGVPTNITVAGVAAAFAHTSKPRGHSNSMNLYNNLLPNYGTVKQHPPPGPEHRQHNFSI
eukprot:GHUV01040981.1.p1 GENE.GHUV01040981.1~~GHUV01040981.1.p1  ORF type:complete len:148 (-),score=9.32 GHUV01040981.1:335-778(-)